MAWPPHISRAGRTLLKLLLTALVVSLGGVALVQVTAPLRGYLIAGKARAELQAGNNISAQRLFLQSIAIFPGNGSVHFELAQLYYQDFLAPEYQRFTEGRPSPEFPVFFGNITNVAALFPAFRSEWPEIVIRELTEAERYLPDGNTYYLRGMCQAMLGRFGLAVEDYHRALVFLPGNQHVTRRLAEAHFEIGLRDWARGAADEALLAWTEGLVWDPRHPRLHACLGLALLRTGKYNQSRASLERALDIRPFTLEARLGLAEAELRSGNCRAAGAHLLRLAVSTDRLRWSQPTARRLAAELAEEALAEEASVESLHAAMTWRRMERKPLATPEHFAALPPDQLDHPTVRYWRATMLVQQRQLEEAHRELNLLLSEAPNHLDGLQLWRQLTRSPRESNQVRARLADLTPSISLNRIAMVRRQSSPLPETP